jgi:alanine-glyoxylate transaminase/serine-glyoxylate transaminase/serine-pyruvate transaminase
LQAGLEAMGLVLHADAGYRLPVLTTVRIPDGVNDVDVRGALLRRHSIEIGGGLGDLRGKVWRLGLMGESSNPGNVLLALSSLGKILREQGFAADISAAVSAATARLEQA